MNNTACISTAVRKAAYAHIAQIVELMFDGDDSQTAEHARLQAEAGESDGIRLYRALSKGALDALIEAAERAREYVLVMLDDGGLSALEYYELADDYAAIRGVARELAVAAASK